MGPKGLEFGSAWFDENVERGYRLVKTQSTPVFAFAHLLGIKLMPRIRHWKNLTFYRSDKQARYKHIDGLFQDAIDWDLIETHWQDLLQVAISIQAGKVSSAMLLRKLGNYSRKNKLYLAAQEVGRVDRTIYLLKWISDVPTRHEVTAGTNKAEEYHGLAKWIRFGGEGVIAENDPDEQQKRVRYVSLVAAAIMFQNAVDMTRAIKQPGARWISREPRRRDVFESVHDPQDQTIWRIRVANG